MDDATFKTATQVIVIVMGVLVPVVGVLFNRALKDNDNKIEKLFSKCDDISKCLVEKAVQIGKLQEMMERFEKELDKLL